MYKPKYFTIEELCYSDTAKKFRIDNTPTPEVRNNLMNLIEYILDPLREKYGKPIKVNSGYRCDKLNTLVKGSMTSQHRFGQASDITVGNIADNKKLFSIAQEMKLPYDQIILEYGGKWVHISYSPRHRRQVLHIG